jgi:DNA-binding beta-propeller fold protein YncE
MAWLRQPAPAERRPAADLQRHTTSGCGQRPAKVIAGTGSADYNTAMAIDQAAGTPYVASWTGDTLSMIGTAGCSAAVTSGCGRAPHVVRVGRGPDAVAVNAATHTVYAANSDDDTVSVLNAASCNAAVTSGCGALPSRLLRTGRSPQWVTVDQATGTLYGPNADDGTISVLDGASCNATVSGGCS